MIDLVEYILALSILVALLALGAVITIGNERVRRATLQVKQVAHEYALADLALRREQIRRGFTFTTQTECLQVLAQIALDAAGERFELTSLEVAPGSVVGLIVPTRTGSVCIFTPSASAFLGANSAYARRTTKHYPISGLNSNPFVIEELEAVAHGMGLAALPRTQEWSLVVVPTEDYSLLPQRGLGRILKLN